MPESIVDIIIVCRSVTDWITDNQLMTEIFQEPSPEQQELKPQGSSGVLKYKIGCCSWYGRRKCLADWLFIDKDEQRRD